MVIERFAKKGAAVTGSGIGGFFGGLFSSPSFLILGALGVALLFFAGDIRKAFGSLGENFGKVELPDITLPTFNFPQIEFPSFEFPDIQFPSFDIDFPDIQFPEFPDIAGGFSDAGESTLDFFGGLQDQFNQFIGGLGGGAPVVPDVTEILQPTQEGGGGGISIQDELNIIVGRGGGGAVEVPIEDPFDIGGGVGFEGGRTTFGGGIVDTLSEVLALFPDLTASQARDALSANPDLTQAEFRQIDPDIINLSSEGVDPDQIFNNTSDPRFQGLTPEEIARILTGGNISNF